jgi:hypothetical protein
MEDRFEPNLLEIKAFSWMLLFGLVDTIIYYLQINLPYFLNALQLSSYPFVISIILFNEYSYFFHPILMFIVFYFVCGRNFPDKAASTLISFIGGNLTGRWIGGLIMSGVLIVVIREATFVSGLMQLIPQLEYQVIYDVMLAFTAVAAAWLVRKWDEMLLKPESKWSFERPDAITVASIIYTIFGILTLCALPILFVYSYIVSGSFDLILIVSMGVLVVINGVTQLMIGRGIYMGRRWGWVAAFAISLISLAVDTDLLIVFVAHTTTLEPIIIGIIVGTVISLLLSLIVVLLLLPLNSRIYCRMINPRTVAEESTT